MKKIISRSFIIGLIIHFCNYACYYLTTPIIVPHLNGIGIDSGKAGIISGTIFVVMIVARPFAGFISDRRNGKRVLLFTSVIYIVSFSGMALSKSFGLILLFRILFGVGLCLLSNVSNTYMLSEIPREKMGVAISYMGLVPAICSGIFPRVGMIIIDHFGTAAVFGFSAGISALIFIPVFMMKTTRPVQTEHKKLSFSDFISFKVAPYALLAGAFAVSIGVVNAFVVSTAQGNQISDSWLFFTVSALVMIVLKLSSGYLIDKKGLKIVAIPSFILTIIALLLIPNAASLGLLIVCAVLFAFSQGAGQPAMQTQCCRMVPLIQRGVAISTFYLAISIGQAVGNIVGGFLAKQFGLACPYYFSAVLLVVALLFFLGILKKKNV